MAQGPAKRRKRGVDAEEKCLTDFQGLELTTRSSAARDAINTFIKEVLSYGQNWDVILDGLKADPTSVMVHVLACDFEVARLNIKEALAHLSNARTHYEAGNHRERLYVQAWEQWLQGQMPASLDTFFQICRAYPQDLMAMKRGQLVAFLLGDAHKLLELCELKAVQSACMNRPYYQGMLGFALEQNEKLHEAEAAGRKGTEICADDAWSHHAVAHALFFQQRWQDGIDWMESKQHLWSKCMSFMFTHNHFHRGLFFLARSQIHRAMSVLDTAIWPEATDSKADRPVFPCNDKTYWQDQLAALGLLWKIELRDGDGGERWARVLDHVALPPAHIDPLFELHLVHALGRVGKHSEVEVLLDGMEQSARSCPDAARRGELLAVWIGVGRALAAANKGLHSDAASIVLQIMGPPPLPPPSRLSIVSGSCEQREVVHEQIVDMLCRAGEAKQAELYWKRAKITQPPPDGFASDAVRQ